MDPQMCELGKHTEPFGGYTHSPYGRKRKKQKGETAYRWDEKKAVVKREGEKERDCFDS